MNGKTGALLHELVVGHHAYPNLVDSLLHPQAVLIRKLLTRPGRQELNQILIDDEENILQALQANVTIQSLYYSGDEAISEDLRIQLSSNIEIFEVAKRTCKKIFENDKISRIFAIAQTPKPFKLESLTQIRKDIVVLEDVSISGNVGSIIRTSLALGIGSIVLLNTDPVDIYDRRLIRASRGYLFTLPIVTAKTEELINFCTQKQIQLLVTDAQATKHIHEIASLPQQLMIVFGSEKEGCSQILKNASTLQIRIPTDKKVESLNVSTAAGITLYNRIHFNQAG
jgi:TrmH family RNA methyltransferase